MQEWGKIVIDPKLHLLSLYFVTSVLLIVIFFAGCQIRNYYLSFKCTECLEKLAIH